MKHSGFATHLSINERFEKRWSQPLVTSVNTPLLFSFSYINRLNREDGFKQHNVKFDNNMLQSKTFT